MGKHVIFCTELAIKVSSCERSTLTRVRPKNYIDFKHSKYITAVVELTGNMVN